MVRLTCARTPCRVHRSVGDFSYVVRKLRGTLMGNSDRYLVVSADGHAGPPAEQYREHLEEQYRPTFDKFLNEQEIISLTSPEFRAEWEEETGDHELLAAYDSD